MNEDKQILEAAKALGIGELLPVVYRDMLQPAARELGDGLATVAKSVKIALAPLKAGVWGYEQIEDWLSVRVTRILADRKVLEPEPPPLSIAGPLVLQMAFAKDEPDLKEMYASLLASAMDPDNSSAHPSFVSIIQQLSPDEAKILKYISRFDETLPGSGDRMDSIENANYYIEERFNEWCGDAGVTNIERTTAYLDNLIRLRILASETSNEVEYFPRRGDRFGAYEATVDSSYYAFIWLTEFGRLFLDACVEKGAIASCLCCKNDMEFGRPKVCPICRYVFQGNGWDGIDAHWRSKHEDVMPYEDFWNSLCDKHK